MATMKEVAELAGVSIATVSRVLSNPDAVKPATRDKVLCAVDKLNYQPNYLGRTLRLMKTRRILLVMDTISNPFFSRVVHGIEDRTREENYHVLLCVTHGKADNFREYAKMLQTHEVDGLIVTTHDVPESEIVSLARTSPVVGACEPYETRQIPTVSIDHEKAACDAVRFLLSRHMRRIAIFGAGSRFYSSALRVKGSLKALREAGLEPYYLCEEGYTYKAGVRAVEKMRRDLPGLPDAIFAFSDSAAVGAVSALTKAGFCVPDDIGVIGFDNTAMAEYTVPALTTVSQPQYTIGYRSADLLLRCIEGKPAAQKHIVVSHEITQRASL